MGRRTLLLIASILVAAVGTALIFMYVRSVQDTANEQAEPVRVVIAQSPVTKGTSVEKALGDQAFKEVSRPRADVPADAFTALSELNDFKQSTVLRDVTPLTIISRTSFSSTTESESPALGKNQVGISIQLENSDRVAGLIKPGSTVAIMLTPAKEGQSQVLAYYLMRDITVISVGINGQAEAVPGAIGETVDNNIIAVAVNPLQALKLKSAEDGGGQLGLALQGSDVQIDASTKITDLSFG